jgi:photosystem II stability/assembly factor-like uncharacterized protein
MKELRRRELFALAALPLGCLAQPPAGPALQKPEPRPDASGPDSKQNASKEALLGPEIPAGTVQALASGPYQGLRWRIRFQFDELGKRGQLQDFAMPTPEFGLATILVEEEDSGSIKSRLVLTRDGGKTWRQEKCDKNPEGVFVLDSTHGWYVASGRVFATRDGGQKWDKYSLPHKAITQVWFAAPESGFAFGVGKVFYRTADGGRKWSAVPESESLNLQSPQTFLRSLAMLPSGAGMLVGDSTAAPPEAALPDWMTPDRAMSRKSLPGTVVLFQTHDGGKSWNGQLSSAFGSVRRVRMGPSRAAVVFQYGESFAWPSELFALNLRTGKNSTVLRRKDLVIQDALLFSDGSMLAAATQPSGRLRNSPIPGKLRVFWSPDAEAWFEMKVDYRATGNSATFASCSDGTLWIATDEGAIVQLAG